MNGSKETSNTNNFSNNVNSSSTNVTKINDGAEAKTAFSSPRLADINNKGNINNSKYEVLMDKLQQQQQQQKQQKLRPNQIPHSSHPQAIDDNNLDSSKNNSSNSDAVLNARGSPIPMLGASSPSHLKGSNQNVSNGTSFTSNSASVNSNCGSAGGGGGGNSREVKLGGRYVLRSKLGGGSFGDIYRATDTMTGRDVAVKVEQARTRHAQLQYESKVYRLLHTQLFQHCQNNQNNPNSVNVDTVSLNSGVAGNVNCSGDSAICNMTSGNTNNTTGSGEGSRTEVVIGIPAVYWFGQEEHYSALVMELCGPSLEDLFNYCLRQFSLKTVLMLAEQMLNRIEFIHSRGIIHRDIKPENFCFGLYEKGHVLQLIDFGLCKRYSDVRSKLHIPFRDGKPLTGTARYCSNNAHRGYEQSRRDDLESIGYLLIYFYLGQLPWQGIAAQDAQTKTIRIGEKKISLTPEELCRDCPAEFATYIRYCRGLQFSATPDYNYLRGIFSARMEAINASYDWQFDWFEKRDREVSEAAMVTSGGACNNSSYGSCGAINSSNNNTRFSLMDNVVSGSYLGVQNALHTSSPPNNLAITPENPNGAPCSTLTPTDKYPSGGIVVMK